MRGKTPILKLFLASLSVLLVFLIWGKGLEESFSRPSVTPTLSLHQQEIALLAEPSIPSTLRLVILGDDPRGLLVKALKAIPFDEMNERQRLLLAGLDDTWVKGKEVLSRTSKSSTLSTFQKILIDSEVEKTYPNSGFQLLENISGDPLLKQVGCFAIGGESERCIDPGVSKAMAIRLLLSQGFPLVAVLLGTGWILVGAWRLLRKSFEPWPELTSLPLSLLDMTLLVGGGFVVLGEVAAPLLLAPITAAITSGFAPAMQDAMKVIIGYCIMSIAPLVILRNQLTALGDIPIPSGGWLQWRLRPVGTAVLQALRGWLMVMPFVLLSGWLSTLLFGDQGGSNPLLEMVLGSENVFALSLLVLTTVVLAPLFEEVIFRGVLLPVLVKSLGPTLGIASCALFFGIAHLSVGELAPLFVLGIGLSIVRLSSGRLLPSILMHSLWNGITFTNLLLLGG